MGLIREMKPCPLCKSNNIVAKELGVLCNNCGIFLGQRYKDGKFTEAINRWNRRPPTTNEETP